MIFIFLKLKKSDLYIYIRLIILNRIVSSVNAKTTFCSRWWIYGKHKKANWYSALYFRHSPIKLLLISEHLLYYRGPICMLRLFKITMLSFIWADIVDILCHAVNNGLIHSNIFSPLLLYGKTPLLLWLVESLENMLPCCYLFLNET